MPSRAMPCHAMPKASPWDRHPNKLATDSNSGLRNLLFEKHFFVEKDKMRFSIQENYCCAVLTRTSFHGDSG
jgi:hypothetical protein